MTTDTMRLAVFASGGGSNFQSILDAVDKGDLPASIVVCVSDNADAGALDRAERHGLPTRILTPDVLKTPSSCSNHLLECLHAHEVNFVALAGYLRKIPTAVVDAYEHRMLNIHPALLPAFGGKGMYGMRVHRAVLEYGVRWTGATVHLVDEHYDNGPIVLQEPVRVEPDDTPETLAARVLQVEHRLYPEALRLFAQNRVTVDGRRVRISRE